MRYIDPRGKLLSHIDRLAQIHAGGNPPPVNAEIDLSNRCSLGCKWCHFAYTHTRGPLAGKHQMDLPGGDLMDYDLALSIIDQLEQVGVKSITWTGGGEPTLHPKFDEIVRYTHAAGLHQGIYTHGGHIDKKRADMMSHHMNWIYVSLDAVNRGDYLRDKGVDRFEVVCQNVLNLTDAAGDATVGVGFLITEQNWRNYKRMLLLGRALKADYMQFRPTVLYDMDRPGTLVESTGWMLDMMDALREIENEPGVQLDMARFDMYRTWKGHDYARCWFANLQTVITPNGKVWTCVNKRQIEELGDLSMESFADVWAKRNPVMVNDQCRVMCRGHIPNLTIASAFEGAPAHQNFI